MLKRLLLARSRKLGVALPWEKKHRGTNPKNGFPSGLSGAVSAHFEGKEQGSGCAAGALQRGDEGNAAFPVEEGGYPNSKDPNAVRFRRKE